jgi:N-methylhydantoinase A
MAAVDDLVLERFPREAITTLRYAGMRYRGQSYDVMVPASSIKNTDDLKALEKSFHDAHNRRYGHMAEGEIVEIVNFKVVAVGPIPKPDIRPAALVEEPLPPPMEVRNAFFGGDAASETPVWQRSALKPGMRIEGPAILEEKTSTIVIYPRQRAQIDRYFSCEITTT